MFSGKRHTCWPAGLLLIATLSGCGDQAPSVTPVAESPPTRDTVTVDYTMAERGIEWLELAAGGADDEKLRAHFFERVAPTQGCGAIIRHWARFREWDEEIFYEFILKGLGRIETAEPLQDERGNPTRLGHARRLWTAALADPAALRRDLENLREADLRQVALERARRYLPDDADVTNSFHVVLFGASTAFSVGEANGFDLLQLAKTPGGTLDVDRVIATFAHEMHHSGFAHACEVHMAEVKEHEPLRLVGVLAAEGTATWFLTSPIAHLEVYRTSSDPGERELASDWDRHLADLPQLYPAAEEDLRRGLAGELTREELMSRWVSGMAGAAYVLGADICRTIEEELGVEAVKPVAQDYRRLLAVYNRAAKQANDRGAERYLFDQALVEEVASFTG
ncbi:MAG: hypothetical protein GY856_19405 [bacterium]|nr:hypothetical protein [bacterium]